MRIKLDKTICDGFGPCATHAPEVFSLDDWGYAATRNGRPISADHRDGVRRAILDCPVHAISELPASRAADRNDSAAHHPTWSRTWDSTAEGWARFAAVNDEFFSAHSHPDKAKAVGLPGAVGMGNLRFQYQNAMLDCCVPPELRVARYQCRLTELDILGDRLTAWAEPEPTDDANATAIVVRMGVRNQRDKECAPGRAILTPNGARPAADQDTRPPEHDVATARQLGIEHWLHRNSDPIHSWPIDANDVRRWRIAIAWAARDINAEWTRALTVPRLFNPFAWNPQYRPAEFPWMPPVGETPGARVLNGGIDVHFYAPMAIGDTVTCSARLLGCRTRSGSLGEMLILTDEQRWTNPAGALINKIIRSTIYY